MKIKTLLFSAALFLLFSFGQQESFVFRDKDRMVQLEFENNQLYLELEKPTEFKISVENIDLKNTAVVGPGIRITGKHGENFIYCTVTAHEKYLVDNNLEIRFYINGEDKKILIHKFLVPVRK